MTDEEKLKQDLLNELSYTINNLKESYNSYIKSLEDRLNELKQDKDVTIMEIQEVLFEVKEVYLNQPQKVEC
ncbi:MAG: hypothetical protein QXP59_03845 [Saccharolobus sp.]